MVRINKTHKKYYANIPDLSQLPPLLLSLVMSDWFDKGDTIFDDARVDGMYVCIIGKDTEQIEARTKILKSQKKVRNGGSVRIKVKGK